MSTKYSRYDIAGYTYQGAILCPDCTAEEVGEAVHGAMPRMDWEGVEEYLDRVSGWFIRDRYNETTYDDYEFPKVVFADVDELDFDYDPVDFDCCEKCGEEL